MWKLLIIIIIIKLSKNCWLIFWIWYPKTFNENLEHHWNIIHTVFDSYIFNHLSNWKLVRLQHIIMINHYQGFTLPITKNIKLSYVYLCYELWMFFLLLSKLWITSWHILKFSLFSISNTINLLNLEMTSNEK